MMNFELVSILQFKIQNSQCKIFMSKMSVVLKHEFKSIAMKPSFWFGILVMPFIIGIIVVVVGVIGGAATAATLAETQNRVTTQGFVDLAGLIKQPENGFKAFDDEAAAKQALVAGEIEAFYVVPADYLKTGSVRMVANNIELSPTGPRSRSDEFGRMLNASLIGDPALAQQINQRITIAGETPIATSTEQRGGPTFGGFSPLVYGIAILFMIVLTTASAYLMQSVTQEKENRVMEVLMSSVTPRDLLAGKILGVSLVGLIQMALWFGSSIFALTSLPFLSSVVGPISPAAVLLTVLYFALGYFVYASLLAGLGALMPGSREAAQYTFLVLIPLFIPLYLNQAIGAEPNGVLAIALSLFPMTSPIVMPMRMFSVDVPAWQVTASVVLLAGMAYLAVAGAARVFRAQSLLSGSKPTFKQVVAAFRG
jgi:ABC-2 type transport system permease protein